MNPEDDLTVPIKVEVPRDESDLFAEELARALDMQSPDGVLSPRPPQTTGNKRNGQGGWAAGRVARPDLIVHGEFTGDGKPQIIEVSHTHNAIMDWMILNPEKALKDCAAFFGYSQSWLSIITRSDAFQAQLKAKQGKVFEGIAAGIQTKLEGVAHVGVEKLGAILETSTDGKFIHEVTKTALAAIGFGPKGHPGAGAINAQNVQQNFYVASPGELEAARGRISGTAAVSLPEPDPARGEATQTLEDPGPARGQAQSPGPPGINTGPVEPDAVSFALPSTPATAPATATTPKGESA